MIRDEHISSVGFAEFLRDPQDGSAFSRIEGHKIYFQSGNSYPLCDGVPILIDEERSIFSVADILNTKPTTQDAKYSSQATFKGKVRRRMLPQLAVGTPSSVRWAPLKKLIASGRVLILGTGEKAEQYRAYFCDSEVITSDVHLQFGVDVVFDAHQIPFKDETFSLVLAAQVLEHTARPWEVAAEAQRVTRIGGYIQMEVPFAFPYHAMPYDFYRFTPSALRFLFAQSEIVKLGIEGGAWGATAIATSTALVDSFTNRYFRMATLAGSRLCLWWVKYLDRLGRNKPCTMPKGLAVTYRRDGQERTDREMLEDLLVYY
jgi:hypothetical protein